jgi:hypothetical protein
MESHRECTSVITKAIVLALLCTMEFLFCWANGSLAGSAKDSKKQQVAPAPPSAIEKPGKTAPSPTIAPSSEKIQKKDMPQFVPKPICPELVATLTLTKTLGGPFLVLDGADVFTGTVNLDGQVCNTGTADYVAPPLVPIRAILSRCDPDNPLADGSCHIIVFKAINSLTKGSCIRVPAIYRIEPLIFGWGIREPRHSYEIQTRLEFSLYIGRDVPSDPNFRANEDCDTKNNIAKERIEFMAWENTSWR